MKYQLNASKDHCVFVHSVFLRKCHYFQYVEPIRLVYYIIFSSRVASILCVIFNNYPELHNILNRDQLPSNSWQINAWFPKIVHLKMAAICLTNTSCSVALTNYLWIPVASNSSQWHNILTVCENDIVDDIGCK